MWRELSTDSRIWKKLCLQRWLVDAENFRVRVQQLTTETQNIQAICEGLAWKQLYKENYVLFRKYSQLIIEASRSLWENFIKDTQQVLEEQGTLLQSTDLWVKVLTQWNKYLSYSSKNSVFCVGYERNHHIHSTFC
jgi:TRAP-type mannitol/chloroaromatic compound transport system substrate-binding protein